MQTKVIERYFFFTLFFLVIVFVGFIFSSFLSVLVISASFAVVLYPIYEWLLSKKISSPLAAFLVLLFFTFALCVPFLSIGLIVFNQAQDFYISIVHGGTAGNLLTSFGHNLNNVLPIHFDINEKLSNLSSFILDHLSGVFSFTLSTLFSFVLVLLSIFYFLKDGAQFRKGIILLSPLTDKDDEKIINRLSKAVNGVMRGYLFIGIIQGVLMGFGLFIFGVPSAALWGVVAALASLIPTVGTALISVPAIIFLFAIGHNGAAIGLGVWAIVVVGLVDNLLSPVLVGSKINLPPFLILFSVLGGISIFGPVGVLIGPLAVSLLYTLVSIYRTDFKI